MGWNQGYTIFESTVIGAYDLGVLDRALLAVLMEPYRGSDIDRGGSRDLRTRDGKSVEQVVVEVFGGKMPRKPKVPTDPEKMTDAHRDACERYWDTVSERFGKVSKKFGWS